MAIWRTLKKKICRKGKERRGMYYIKSGKQARIFFKYLRKAAMSGRLPKKYLFRWFRIQAGRFFCIIKNGLCSVLYEARTVSKGSALLVGVGAAVTALALNVCVLSVEVTALQSEKTQLAQELTDTKTALEKDIEVLTDSLESNRAESETKDEIIEEQKNALADSEAEKEDLIAEFTEQINNLDLTGGAASRSSADLSNAKNSLAETEMLIRDALGYTETADALVAKLHAKAEALQDTMDRYPDFYPTIGEVNSPFGYRRHPITGETKLHSGQDIGSGTGTPIWAAAKGTVSYVGYEDGYGYHICIDHGNGLSTKYAHLSEMLVSVGDEVGKGDLIARMGATGRVTGPHLHFEVIRNGECVDPADYIG